MDMWENIAQKVGNAANSLGKEAVKLTDSAKNKYNTAVKEGKLEKIFESIGRLHYDELKTENDNSAKIAQLVIEADEINAEIDALRQKAGTNEHKCAECGVKVANSAMYCPNCGAAQEK